MYNMIYIYILYYICVCALVCAYLYSIVVRPNLCRLCHTHQATWQESAHWVARTEGRTPTLASEGDNVETMWRQCSRNVLLWSVLHIFLGWSCIFLYHNTALVILDMWDIFWYFSRCLKHCLDRFETFWNIVTPCRRSVGYRLWMTAGFSGAQNFGFLKARPRMILDGGAFISAPQERINME